MAGADLLRGKGTRTPESVIRPPLPGPQKPAFPCPNLSFAFRRAAVPGAGTSLFGFAALWLSDDTAQKTDEQKVLNPASFFWKGASPRVR